MRTGRSLAVAAAVLALAAAAAPASEVASQPPKPQPSALAPHHTAKRSFGAPIQSQILHKRQAKKPAKKAAPVLRSTPLPDSSK